MHKIFLRIAFAIATAAATSPAAPAASSASSTPDKNNSAWWGHIKVLASDEFAGRLTGSPGYGKAAQYVADEFRKVGLEPAGTRGYFQSVAFVEQSINSQTSVVDLVSPAGVSTNVSDDLVLSPGVLQRPSVDARLVFVGYGIHLPELGYDDFAGSDVHGAIVVYVVGGPSSVSGAQRAHNTAEVLPHYLENAGAIGLLSITLPRNREIPWARQKAAGEQPGMVLAEKALRRYQGDMFAASFDETKAESLFAGSGHTFSEIEQAAIAHAAMPHFALVPTLRARVETSVREVSSNNVVAELRGSMPAASREAVVLSAHLDHLGTGKPDHGDGIFRGAMDDASGVATLLDIADRMRKDHVKPKRSILFVAVCGEEKGLLGSRYFAANPSRYPGHIVADLNSDMFLPLYPLRQVVGFGADESSLGEDLRTVGAELHVTAVADPLPDHLVFVRADQYSFVRKGIPALMLQMVPQPGTAEQATYDRWFSERYHAQADNLEQPVDLAAAEDYSRLVYRLAMRIADAPTAPKWNGDSFFAKFASHPLT